MDSIENTALIGALLRVRNIEDLQTLKTTAGIVQDFNDTSANVEKIADYPGGINTLRQEVADLLYVDGVNSNSKTVKTDVVFIVEKDGTISNVHAQEIISRLTGRQKLRCTLFLKNFPQQW